MATSGGTADKENVVIFLQKHPFTRCSLEEKKQDNGTWIGLTQYINSAAGK